MKGPKEGIGRAVILRRTGEVEQPENGESNETWADEALRVEQEVEALYRSLPKRCQSWLDAFAVDGATVVSACREIELSVQALHAWRDRVPGFDSAYLAAKLLKDAQLEGRLIERALTGYEETKIRSKADGSIQWVEQLRRTAPTDLYRALAATMPKRYGSSKTASNPQKLIINIQNATLSPGEETP